LKDCGGVAETAAGGRQVSEEPRQSGLHKLHPRFRPISE
jgi:hypothetical protein